jgi:hypothetical protein
MSFAGLQAHRLAHRKEARPGLQVLPPGAAGDGLGPVHELGLGKSEKVQPLCEIEVVHVSRQSLGCVNADECAREGFPHLTPEQFVAFFTAKVKTPGMGMRINEISVTRIEFRKVPGSECVAVQESLAL